MIVTKDENERRSVKMKNINKILKEIRRISVENMQSNSGNDIPNQFIIRTPNGTIF